LKEHEKKREFKSSIPLRRDDGRSVSETSEFQSVLLRLMVNGKDFCGIDLLVKIKIHYGFRRSALM
jgi:hypothetical protein